MDGSDAANVVAPIIVVGFVGLLAYAVYWRRKYRSRYIVDENGERQRVIKWSHGIPVYNPKSWKQRVHEEVLLRSERRKTLLGVMIIAGPLVGLAFYLGQDSETLQNIVLAVVIVAALTTAAQWLPALASEIRYQFGDQSMEGAKVLDKAPKPPPGREVVEAQKAHGDARLASETQALELLRSQK